MNARAKRGLYIINIVDEITQFQQLAAVSRTTEYFMIPVLKALTSEFPFTVLGFHADNGSEYINHHVARMLNKLHVTDFTKSRPRRSNDNALVESKNGNTVRRWLGRIHIPRSMAGPANTFHRDFEDTLCKAGLPLYKINPYQVRCFARSREVAPRPTPLMPGRWR